MRKNVDPFMDKNSPSYHFLMELDPTALERIVRYRSNWKMYEGDHWQYQDPSNETLNYISTLIDVKTKFLTKNSFDIKMVEDPMTGESEKESRDWLKYLLDDTWDRNEKEELFEEIANVGHVTGDVFIRPRIAVDEADDELYVALDLVYPHLVFPVYGEDHSYGRRKMNRCYIFIPQVTAERERARGLGIFGRSDIDFNVTWLIEEWTPDMVTVYDSQIGEDNVVEGYPQMHKYGEVPVVHIRNRITGNSDFGISDVQDQDKAQKLLNEKVARFSEIVDYHAAPILFLSGAKIDVAELGPDKIWQTSNKDAKLAAVKLDDDLRATQDFIKLVYEYMLQNASVPEQAVNPTKNISNTPGVALHMAYLPLIEDRNRKIKTYSSGIRRINRLIIKTMEDYDPSVSEALSKIKRGKYKTKISFGPDLPRDESLELDKAHQKLDMGLTTKMEALLDMGYGRLDAERIIRENIEERRELLELETEFSGAKSVDQPYGKRRRPDPVVQGDKVSTGGGNS